MPCLCPNGMVNDIEGNIMPSSKPPKVKHPPRRPKKNCKESQHQDKVVTCVPDAMRLVIIEQLAKNPHFDTST